MALVHLVIGLALLQFVLFGFAVGHARGRYNVPAPATTGHPVFERYFRVQMNTLELLTMFVPSVWLFGHYVNALAAAALGLVYIIGRLIYFVTYIRDPARRSAGFAISLLPIMVLLFGTLYGAARAALMH